MQPPEAPKSQPMNDYWASLQGFAKTTLSISVGLATIVGGLLYYGQGHLIYPSNIPAGSRENVPKPSQYGLPFEDLTLETRDNIRIKAYLMVQRKILPAAVDAAHIVEQDEEDHAYARRRPTVIILHANAGNMGHRIPLARVLYSKMRCNVFMLSYRGYGLSEGTPSEKGLCIDAQTALDYLLKHPVLSSTKILLYGQSLGGAVAVNLASRSPDHIHGLILENTFLSMPRLIPSVMPFLSPVTFLCHQKWDSATAMTKIPQSTPIIMLSGRRDEVVPPEHMDELWKIACENGEKNRMWVTLQNGTHNDTCIQPTYWDEVTKFVNSFSSEMRAKA